MENTLGLLVDVEGWKVKEGLSFIITTCQGTRDKIVGTNRSGVMSRRMKQGPWKIFQESKQ